MATRMIVENVKNWVYARVKPEILRWIHDIRQNRLQIHSRTPSGDTVIQRRRAASCEPSTEVVNLEGPISPTSRSRYYTPRRRVRPDLPHNETVPATLGRRLAKPGVLKMQLNGSTEPDEGGVDDSSDEGYASIHTRKSWESEEDQKEDQEEDISAFIYNDEPSEDDSDASYVPPSSEDESTESESTEDEESDGNGESGDDGANSSADSSRGENNEDEYDLSDGERHYHRLSSCSCAASMLEVYCTPTKVFKSAKSLESMSKKDRRRSSRF